MNVRALRLLPLLFPFLIGCTEAIPEGSFFGALVSSPSLRNQISSFKINTLPKTVSVPGECSTMAESVEWSLDQTNWNVISGSDLDCSDETFSMDLTFDVSSADIIMTGTPNEQVQFYIRAQTAIGTTESFAVTVEYDPSYTGPDISFASVPNALTNDPNYLVKVSSATAYAYEYSVVTIAEVCSTASYSSSLDIAVAVSDVLGADGDYKVCVRGVDLVGQVGAGSSIAEYSWTLDTVAPTMFFNAVTLPPSVTNAASVDIDPQSADGAIYYQYKVVGAAEVCSDSSGYSATVSESVNISSVLGADGDYKVCVRGQDAAGNWQSHGSAIEYQWTLDQTPPVLGFLTIPNTLANVAAANFTVDSNDVNAYQYKVGPAGSTDCSVSSGYSAWISIGSPNFSYVAGGDGTYKVCAVGEDVATNPQLYASATSMTWTYDSTAPSVIFAGLPAAVSTVTTLGVDVAGVDVVSYKYKLGPAANCSLATGYSAEISEATNITNSLPGMNSYTLCAVGKDAAGNWQPYASATTYTWFHNPVLLAKWSGAAGDEVWTNPSNWVAGIIPDSNDQILVSSTYCGTNCDVQLNGNLTVDQFDLASGTVDLNGYNLNVTASLTIAAGASLYRGCTGNYTAGSFSAAGNIYTGNHVFLYVDDSTVPESSAMAIYINLSRASCEVVNVNYNTADGDATAAVDYTSVSGTASFPTGTVNIPVSVPIVNDGVDEADEYFTLNLSSASTGVVVSDPVAMGTILDDDAPPDIIVSVAAYAVEGSTLGVTVNLSAPSEQTVSVDYYTTAGTAIGGSDFGSVSSTLVFAPFETSKMFSINILDDGPADGEGYEDFYIHLANSVNGNIPATPFGAGIVRFDTYINGVYGVNPTLTSMDVDIFYDGDFNGDTAFEVYYCNMIDDPACITWNGPYPATDMVGYHRATVSHLYLPDDPGDSLKFRVQSSDPDGSNAPFDSSGFPLAMDMITPTFGGINDILSLTDTSVHLFWETAGDNYNKPEDISYHICYSTSAAMCSSGFSGTIVVTSPGELGHQITGLTPGVDYYFAVRAVDSSGNMENNAVVIARNSIPTVKVVSGYAHSCSLNAANQVRCWGDNSSGQLGDGTYISKSRPTYIMSGVLSISAGYDFTCAIRTDNTVWCWGANNYGQLGTNNTSPSNIPVMVAGGYFFDAITSGSFHSCAMQTGTGNGYCWGKGASNALGNGSTVNRLLPWPISFGYQYMELEAGDQHTCGIQISGALFCWGTNTYGRLGDGSTMPRSAPVVVDSGTSYSNISAGYDSTCGVTSTGNLRCWGNNSHGQLGTGTTGSYISVPTNVGTSYSFVEVGGRSACAVNNMTQLFCWGANDFGQLGDSTYSLKNLPTSVTGFTSVNQLALSVSPGGSSTCADKAGQLYCWGANTDGQLGLGRLTASATPVSVSLGSLDIKKIARGSRHACALTAAGEIYCWGANDKKQLGIGAAAVSYSDTPVLIPGFNAKDIDAGYDHTCAVGSDNSAYCWGFNSYGQLGEGSTTMKSSPTLVMGIGSVKSVSAGDFHSCAIRSDDSVHCWGDGSSGRLGAGMSSGTYPNPQYVSLSAKFVNAGSTHTCAIDMSDHLLCWGGNADGQIGNNSTFDQITPAFIDGGTTYQNVAAGALHTCAVTTGRQMKCWGDNGFGKLGTNGGSNSLVPVFVDTAGMVTTNEFESVTISGNITCAKTKNKTQACWGLNAYGAMGLPPAFVDLGILRPQESSAFGSVQQLSAGVNGVCTVANKKAYCSGLNTHDIGGFAGVLGIGAGPVITAGQAPVLGD